MSVSKRFFNWIVNKQARVSHFFNCKLSWLASKHVMFNGIVAVWVAVLLNFDPRLFTLLKGESSLWVQMAFYTFILLINIFWLYGIYHCFVVFFKLLPKQVTKTDVTYHYPSVAILYTTRNDFNKKSVLSCIQQAYANFHVFILDDSTNKAYKKQINEFKNKHPKHLTVIRRPHRIGFKAGNLNNALIKVVVNYPYFAVIDADEIIPENFLAKLVPYLETYPNIAFVQANHQQNPEQKSIFARDLSLGIDFHWNIYQPSRNDQGFVIFYGHGAILRREVWEKVGGFPEIVSEDLAFATRARTIGYRGLFVEDVVCREDFPETYQQFRARHEKWVKGACEYICKEFWPFLKSGRATFQEKMDVFLSCFSLFLPTLFLIYLFIANAALPLLLAEKRMATAEFMGNKYELIPAYHLEPIFRDLFTLDFYIITLIGMFAPIFPYVGAAFVRPRQVFGLLFKSTIPYISLISVSTCALVLYLLTRKAVFVVTGDKTSILQMEHSKASGFLDRLNANHPLVMGMEFGLGLILTYLAVMTMNFALLGISICLLLSYVVFHVGWENRLLRKVMFLPLSLVLLVFLSMGFDIVGLQGVSLFFLAVHF